MHIFKKNILKIIVPVIDAAGWALSLPFKIFEKQMQEPRNILAMRLDHIGDVVMTTPAIEALKRRYPNAKITMLVGSWAKEVVQNNPNIHEIIAFDPAWFSRSKKKTKIKDAIRLIRVLKGKKFDLGMDFRGDFRNIVLMWLAGIKHRVGYGITGGGFLLNKNVQYIKGRHEIEHNMDLTRALGLKIKPGPVEFYPNAEDEAKINIFLSEQGVSDNDKIACIHAGAGFPSKLWRADRFAKLIDKISNEFGIKVILTGGRSDQFTVMDILSLVDVKCISVVGKTNLSQLGWLAKKSALFISTDSGPAHIAAAMGAPVVIIYSGTNDPDQWAPTGRSVKIVKKQVKCSPCGKKECKEKTCMKLTEVEDVFEVVKQILEGKQICTSV